MARSDMRDFEWDFIRKLLPNKSPGVKRVDDRRVTNGIFVRSAHWHPVAGYARTVRPGAIPIWRIFSYRKLLSRIEDLCPG